MLAEARPEPCEDECSCCDADTCSADKFFDVANKHLDAATDELKDPAVHGVMMELILNNMIRWHVHVAEKMLEQDETECAAAWMRDAGKFQAMANILDTVCFGENDPRNCD